MPVLSRWLLRAALLNLVAALVIGLVRVWPGTAGMTRAALAPVATHLLMVGWVTQMIIGVAYWLFPRPHRAVNPATPRAGWFMFAALNAGLLLRAAAEPAVTLGTAAGTPRVLLVTSAVLQLAAVTTAALLLWPRLEPRA